MQTRGLCCGLFASEKLQMHTAWLTSGACLTYCRSRFSGILQQAEPDALASLHDAVVQLAAQPLDAEGGHSNADRLPVEVDIAEQHCLPACLQTDVWCTVQVEIMF